MAKNFQRCMSTNDLVGWLKEKGLSDKDCDRIKEEEFTGESFLLLDRPTCKELGVGIGGQLLVQKLVKEASAADPPNEDSVDTGAAPESSEPPPLDGLRISDNVTLKDMPEHQCDFNFTPCGAVDPCDGGGQSGTCQSGAAAACIVKSKVWEGRQVLRVYFMNPKVLEGWKCEGKKKMTTEMIMEWAGAWMSDNAPSAPQFTVTDRMNKADIRVKFSAKEQCSSLVGMQAASIAQDKPTMTLNLSDQKCPEYFLRHLVIHEFGHALGLEHEHQRSDFWEVIERFMDLERMKDDHRFEYLKTKKAKEAYFGKDYLKASPEGVCWASEYDPDSIMHYWFDVVWLKNKDYHKHQGISSDRNLSAQEKKYLRGIHTRNNNCAKDPSPKDIEILEAAYGEPPQASSPQRTA